MKKINKKKTIEEYGVRKGSPMDAGRAGFRGSRGPWPRAPTSRGPHQNYNFSVCSMLM